MTDINKFFAMAAKHGLWAALAIATLWFMRMDFVLPLVNNLHDMGQTMKALERGQDKLLYHTVHGSWRSVDPPPSSEIPKPEQP